MWRRSATSSRSCTSTSLRDGTPTPPGRDRFGARRRGSPMMRPASICSSPRYEARSGLRRTEQAHLLDAHDGVSQKRKVQSEEDPMRFRIAVVQPISHRPGEDAANVAEAVATIGRAAAEGAHFVCFPETYPGPWRMPATFDPTDAMAEAAARHKLHV